MLDYFRLRGAKVIFISSLNREILNEILIASSFLPFFNVPMSLPLPLLYAMWCIKSRGFINFSQQKTPYKYLKIPHFIMLSYILRLHATF